MANVGNGEDINGQSLVLGSAMKGKRKVNGISCESINTLLLRPD